jgi:hypothetical protein
MEDVLITEHAGSRRDTISRFYQYGGGGVRVLDARKAVKRLYLFDPASNIMTERDSRVQEKVLRRFIFDRYGLLDEIFRYENGGRQIAVREGGDYGAVGKIFTFEQNGITETAWGRHGEIERVYQFDPKGDAITIRAGGWYGDIERTVIFAGIGAALFREPEAFLQFLMFTEWSAKDRDDELNERVAEIRGGAAPSRRSAYAYTDTGNTPPGKGSAGGCAPVQQRRPARAARGAPDSGIDFIPDGDTPARQDLQGPGSRPSSAISFEERRRRNDGGSPELSRGKSAEIPLDERFESSHREPEKLKKGKSAEIPYDERRGGRDR